MCGHLSLVARDAIEAPGEGGDGLGEEGLEAAFGSQVAMMAARCRSQSSKDSISGMTGAFERRPCLTALTLDAALPASVIRLAIGIRLERRGKKKQQRSVTPDVDNYLTD